MSRLKQDPETSYYHFVNENPRDLRAGDCVVRAIVTASGKSWEEVFDGLCEIGRKKKMMPNQKEVYDAYLKSIGFVKRPSMRKSDNTRYRGYEFTKVVKNCIFKSGAHHLSCIKDGKIHDIWNCGSGSVGNYWEKV